VVLATNVRLMRMWSVTEYCGTTIYLCETDLANE